MFDDQLDPQDPSDQSDTTYHPADDDLKHQQSKPPSVLGEENASSGDMAGGEPADIDEELAKVGLHGDFRDDKEEIKPLDVSEEID